jgi:hypothetical protein
LLEGWRAAEIEKLIVRVGMLASSKYPVAERLFACDFDVMVFLTGVGSRFG